MFFREGPPIANEVTIFRTVRFGLHDPPIQADWSNSFAGNPALDGLVPYVELRVAVRGPIDPRTGMLVNIKTIDAVVRDAAVPVIGEWHRKTPARPSLRRFAPAGRMVPLHRHLRLELRPHESPSIDLYLSPYLYLSSFVDEAPVVQLTQRFEFSAAHRLHSDALSAEENVDVFGKCNNPNGHGHNYEIEVTVAGEPNARSGRLIPVAKLQQIVRENVIDLFDHKHLNLDCEPFQTLNPTVENIARVVYDKLSGKFAPPTMLRRVRVWETPKTSCQYPAD